MPTLGRNALHQKENLAPGESAKSGEDAFPRLIKPLAA